MTGAGDSLQARRLSIRRCALANLLLVLQDDARRSRGRFAVEGLPDAMLLRLHDVCSLVCPGGVFAIAPRDFLVAVVAPPLWPFDREAALVPIVAAPMDFAAPNSNGRELCLDVRGVRPERLAELLYDNLRLRNRRLDHPVDGAAADYVRSHLRGRPADPRPLYPEASA